jgi:hypothetical protein
MTPIASDLSYLVLERRRQRGELGLCGLDSSNQRLYPLPSQMAVREAFIADREPVRDSYQGELRVHPSDLGTIPTSFQR